MVVLMYRADWTTLSLIAEVREFEDYSARSRMREPSRPPWAPRPGPGHRAGPDRASAHRVRWPAGDEEDEDDDEPEELSTVHEGICHLLLAPGGRFRLETNADRAYGSASMSDGRVTWILGEEEDEDLDEDQDEDADAASAGPSVKPAEQPCAELLCPAWLPAGYRLEMAGSAVIAGRRAQRVIGTRRPVGRWPARPGQSSTLRPLHRSAFDRLGQFDRVDALIDAELGILLRSELIHKGQVVSRREITSLTLDPPEAADTEQFIAPEGATDSGHHWQFSGPGWERLKTATSLGASAMSFAVRHAPNREPPAGSTPSPADTPAAGGGEWTGQPGPGEPVSAHILVLLYEAGLRHSEFDAELRTWADAAASTDAFRRLTRQTTLSGVSQLGEALNDRATTWQSREALRIGLPNRFRIDYIDGGMKQRKATTQATDGLQRWRVFPGYMTVGPARSLPEPIALLADPSWLLDWQLTGGAEVHEGGRRAFRVRIGQRSQTDDPARLSSPVDAIIDAELGILLRLTREQAGRPAKQQTLSEVIVRATRAPAEFRIEIPAGTRVIQDSGGLTDEMPAPVQTAAHLAGKAFSAAFKVGGFLDSLRKTRKDGPGAR